MDNFVGKQVGDYRIIRLLGQGGYGVVYEAEHIRLHRKQTIKFLQDFNDLKSAERFLKEAQVVAQLDHPNIVHIDTFDIDQNVPYLVMPFIGGGTLLTVLTRGRRLSVGEVEQYFSQICAAVEYIHKQQVVHLDIKPQNILVHDNDRLLLTDFGLARLMKRGTLEGGISLQAGTAFYMAPEHIMGKPDRRSDIYSLGITLYQMLTGRVPFEGINRDIVAQKHLNECHPPLRTNRPELPEALEAVINKALAKNPKERYQCAGELLSAFKAAVSGYSTQPLINAQAKKTAENHSTLFNDLPTAAYVGGGIIAAVGGGVILFSAFKKLDADALMFLAGVGLLLIGVLMLYSCSEGGMGGAPRQALI